MNTLSMYIPGEVRTYCCRPDLVTLAFRPCPYYQRDWLLSPSHIRLIMVDGLTDYHVKQSRNSHPQRWHQAYDQPSSSTTSLETFFTAGIYFFGSSALNKFTFMQFGSLEKPAGGRVPILSHCFLFGGATSNCRFSSICYITICNFCLWHRKVLGDEVQKYICTREDLLMKWRKWYRKRIYAARQFPTRPYWSYCLPFRCPETISDWLVIV